MLITTYCYFIAVLGQDSYGSLDVGDVDHWSEGKEYFDVRGQRLVEGEAGKAHDGALGVAHVKQV